MAQAEPTDELNVGLEALSSAHLALCEWGKHKPKGAVRSSEREGALALRLLKRYGRVLESLLQLETPREFNIQISRGKSNLPSVLWVAVVPNKWKAYNSMSVATCFGAEGEGSVIGIMDAVTYPRRWLPPRSRARDEITVDLDPKNSKFRYNSKFHNPVEFPRDTFSAKDALAHIEVSCTTLAARLDELSL